MYRVGDAVALTFRVVDPSGAPADATVTLTVDTPAGTPVSPTVTNPSVGVYSAALVPTAAGRHVARWAATGTVQQAGVEIVNVAPVVEPVAIISLERAREQLNMPGDDTSVDDELQMFIDAASAVVEQYTGEVVARRTIVEECYATGNGRLLLRSAPLVSITSVVAADGTEYEATTILDPAAGIITVPAYLYGAVTVTVVAGRAVIPENVQTACAIITAHLWTTQRVPLVSAGFGGETTPNPGRGYLIPNQAAQLLGGRGANRP